MSYRDLEIWNLARHAVIEVHRLTIEMLPKYEMYETGSQIRRSVKSIKANIVEGYGRRRYKMDFIHHLTYAHASCDETIDHSETLLDTGSLSDRERYESVLKVLNELGRKLNRFIRAVDRGHDAFREESAVYKYDKAVVE